MRSPATRGECGRCGYRATRAAVRKHLSTCTQPIQQVGPTGGRRRSEVPALLFEVVGRPKAYWLFLAVAVDAKLSEVDAFLRSTWLECCGHLSQFVVGQTRYSSEPEPDSIFSRGPRARSMHIEIGKVPLQVGARFEHHYDFGSTTMLDLSLLGQLPVPVSSRAVALLAHNDAPAFTCAACHERAAWVCLECDGPGGEGFLCEACADSHECDEGMLRPLVNSPRVGVCGYDGPGAGASSLLKET